VKTLYLFVFVLLTTIGGVYAFSEDFSIEMHVFNSTGDVNTTRSVTVKFYDSFTAGTMVHQQTSDVVFDSDGFGHILVSNFVNGTRDLDFFYTLQIDGDDESSRGNLTSTPQAQRSLNATYAELSNSITGTITESQISDLSHTVDTFNTTEQIQDSVGPMVTGNDEQNISVTYDDGDDEFNFIVTLTSFNWNDLTNVPAGFADGVDDDTDTFNTTEQIQDSVGDNFNSLDGNTSITYNDASDRWDIVTEILTFNWNELAGIPAGFADGVDDGNSTEEIQDAVGNNFNSVDGNTTITYNDASDQWDVTTEILQLGAGVITAGTLADARLDFTLQDAVDDGGCTDCIIDSMVSNTLTASDLVAGSSVVADVEVDNDLTISESGAVDPDSLNCDVGNDNLISEDCFGDVLDTGEIEDVFLLNNGDVGSGDYDFEGNTTFYNISLIEAGSGSLNSIWHNGSGLCFGAC